jgi:protein SCO1/2
MRIDRFFLMFAAGATIACQGAPKPGASADAPAAAAPGADAPPLPSQADSGSGMHGLELVPPREKPDFRLTTTEGKPFDFRRDTEGYATLLFFGYTHCPDVCPLHLSNIAAVLHKLPPDVADRVRMVFVTTDPGRDSAAVVRRYLDKFDRGFVGLVGTEAEILAAQAAARIPPAMKQVVDSAKPDEYLIGHAAFVFAYTPDGKGRFLYPFGVRQASWANDIPRLVQWPAGSS